MTRVSKQVIEAELHAWIECNDESTDLLVDWLNEKVYLFCDIVVNERGYSACAMKFGFPNSSVMQSICMSRKGKREERYTNSSDATG